MNKKSLLITSLIIDAFLSFFDPATLKLSLTPVAASGFVTLAVLTVILYRNSDKISKTALTKKDLFFSGLFSMCMTLGYGLIRRHGFDVFYGSVWSGIITAISLCYYTVFTMYLQKYLYASIDYRIKKPIDSSLESKKGFWSYIYNKINENKISFYFIVLLIAWLPSFIIHFPGMLMYDSIIQLRMHFGIPNKHTEASILINPDQFVTMHHGVIHTVTIGLFADLGIWLFNSLDAGIFMYSFCQYAITAFIIAYIFKSIEEYLGIKWTALFLGIFSFHPFFATGAILVTKDIYFCVFFALYMLKYYELIRNPEKLKNIRFFLAFFAITLALILLRNNAIYTIILTNIVLLIFIKPKIPVLLYFALIMAFNTGYSDYLMPALEVSPGSPREALSVPFQQTAYYVNKFGDEVTPAEKEVISKILDYDTILNEYNPEKSDPIKDTYNKYATDEDMKEYFTVWYDMLLKHPGSYVESFLSLNYGYYFPSVKDSVTYNCFNDSGARKTGIRSGLPFAMQKKPGIYKMAFFIYYNIFAYVPFLCLTTDTGIFIWIWIFTGLYIINKIPKSQRKKYLLYLLPYFAYMIFILLGPVNGTLYFRYVMPFMYSIPLMFMPFFEYKKSYQKDNL